MGDKAASPGLMSRFLPFVGRTNNKGEPPKKPTPAKLGSKNSMYYCEKRKRWIDPATDDGSNDDTNGPPPPPKTVTRVNSPGVSQANLLDSQSSSGAVDNPQVAGPPFKPPGLVSQGSGGKRSLHQRYVNTFSNSKPTENRNAPQATPSAAAFLPPFSNAPNSTRMFVPPANIGGGKVSTFVPSAAEADTKTEDASSSSVPLAPQGNSTSKESSSVEDTSTDKTDKHQPDKLDEQVPAPQAPEMPPIPLVPQNKPNGVNGALSEEGNTIFPVFVPNTSVPNSITKQGLTPTGRPPLHPGQPTHQNTDPTTKKPEGLSLEDILQQAARVTPVHSANPSPMPKMPKETQGEDAIPLQSEHRGLSKKSLHDAFHTAALAMGAEDGKTVSDEVDSSSGPEPSYQSFALPVDKVSPPEENGANTVAPGSAFSVESEESSVSKSFTVESGYEKEKEKEKEQEQEQKQEQKQEEEEKKELDSAELDRRNQEVESLKESYRQLEERCNSQQSQIESFTESINMYQQRLEEKDSEISRLKATNVDPQAYRDTLDKVKQLEDISQQRDREEAALRSRIEQLEHAFREKEKAHEQELLRVESTTLENAQKEADEEMSDLLVCLGQETAKVERLSAALLERGVNIEEMLQGLTEIDGSSSSPTMYDSPPPAPPPATTIQPTPPVYPPYEPPSGVELQSHGQKAGDAGQDSEVMTRSLSQLFKDSSNSDLNEFDFSSSSTALEQLTEAAAMSPHPPAHQQFDQSPFRSHLGGV